MALDQYSFVIWDHLLCGSSICFVLLEKKLMMFSAPSWLGEHFLTSERIKPLSNLKVIQYRCAANYSPKSRCYFDPLFSCQPVSSAMSGALKSWEAYLSYVFKPGFVTTHALPRLKWITSWQHVFLDQLRFSVRECLGTIRSFGAISLHFFD